MAKITKRGRELADRLNDGWPSDALDDLIAMDCSLIARHAVTLHRLYEDACNGHPAMGNPRVPIEQAQRLQAEFEERTERDRERLERRIKAIARGLYNVEGVRFNRDPRGAPVVLVTKDGRGDSWSEPRGWCVTSRS